MKKGAGKIQNTKSAEKIQKIQKSMGKVHKKGNNHSFGWVWGGMCNSVAKADYFSFYLPFLQDTSKGQETADFLDYLNHLLGPPTPGLEFVQLFVC